MYNMGSPFLAEQNITGSIESMIKWKDIIEWIKSQNFHLLNNKKISFFIDEVNILELFIDENRDIYQFFHYLRFLIVVNPVSSLKNYSIR
jgi:hypothetical protein